MYSIAKIVGIQKSMTDTSGLISYVSGGSLGLLAIICIIFTLVQLVRNRYLASQEKQQDTQGGCKKLSEVSIATVNPDGSLAVASLAKPEKRESR